MLDSLTDDRAAAITDAFRTLADLFDPKAPAKPVTNVVATFLAERTYPMPGHAEPTGDVYRALCKWCAENGRTPPTKIEMGKMIPPTIPQGHGVNNVKMIGNISLSPDIDVADPTAFVSIGGKLRR
jgi:hypothetical protein